MEDKNFKDKDYLIFTNKKNGKKLAYYPVAKNANTSVKLFLIRHLGLQENFFYIEDIPRYKHTKEMYNNFEGKFNLIGFLPPYIPFRKIDVDVKCCLVRDPIKRFISTYKNRILFHQDKQFHNYSIDEVIENIENSNLENRHFLPQSYWLGHDLNYYTFYSYTNEINNFVQKINKFFNQKKEFPRLQTGGNKNDLFLSSQQIQKLKKIYMSDFELLKLNPTL